MCSRGLKHGGRKGEEGGCSTERRGQSWVLHRPRPQPSAHVTLGGASAWRRLSSEGERTAELTAEQQGLGAALEQKLFSTEGDSGQQRPWSCSLPLCTLGVSLGSGCCSQVRGPFPGNGRRRGALTLGGVPKGRRDLRGDTERDRGQHRKLSENRSW